MEKLDPDMPAQELRLHMGELTASEVRAARSAIAWANTCTPKTEEQPDDWRTTLCAILYPDGIKHPQQAEWEWMMKRIIELKSTKREAGDEILREIEKLVYLEYTCSMKDTPGEANRRLSKIGNMCRKALSKTEGDK